MRVTRGRTRRRSGRAAAAFQSQCRGARGGGRGVPVTHTLIITQPSGLIECWITTLMLSLDYSTGGRGESLLVTMETESRGNQSCNYRRNHRSTLVCQHLPQGDPVCVHVHICSGFTVTSLTLQNNRRLRLRDTCTVVTMATTAFITRGFSDHNIMSTWSFT